MNLNLRRNVYGYSVRLNANEMEGEKEAERESTREGTIGSFVANGLVIYLWNNLDIELLTIKELNDCEGE